MSLLTKSLLILATATAADTHSSWGKQEANPVLRRGTFGPRQASLKIGLVAGAAAFEYAVLKRSRRRYERPLAFTNFAVAGVTGAVAIRNYGVRK